MTRATATRPGRRADATWLKEHVRLSCTYGMLLCLSRQQRVVYLLVYLLGCTDTDGARICDISQAASRQQPARARAVMRQLMGQRCGVVRASTRAAATSSTGPRRSHPHRPQTKHLAPR
jgi:DNA-directed RNA polymerase specialized sigma24 family protein